VQSSSNYYALAIRSGGQVDLRKVVGGQTTVVATSMAAVAVGTWSTIRFDASGAALSGYVNGARVVSATDYTFSAGKIGFATSYASASFDYVAVDSVPVVVPTPGTTTPVVDPTPSHSAGPCTSAPHIIGFASVPALGLNGTTGGCGGATVTVSNATDFLAAIARPEPLVIRVNGMITLPGPMHDVTSNKTIYGIGSASGFTGGGLNIGLPISDAVTAPPANAVHNVIIQNLVFTNAKDDSINVQMYSHHVWIDHNDLSHGYDGLIDIKRGSSYITVSWNHTHHHTKNMLLGHDDSNAAQDVGYLKVTYHHNFFDQTPQRNPRVRFGEPVHVFNNYYLHNTDIGVACQANSGCVVEGNVFENTEEAYGIDYAGPKGRMIARNNVFIGESFPGTTGGTVQEPSTYYSYSVDDPNSVKASVLAGAGTGHV
jgi:pectate lyase